MTDETPRRCRQTWAESQWDRYCCYRERWREYDRCIWHAAVEEAVEKPVAELRAARETPSNRRLNRRTPGESATRDGRGQHGEPDEDADQTGMVAVVRRALDRLLPFELPGAGSADRDLRTDHPAEFLDRAELAGVDLGSALSFESCTLQDADLSGAALEGAKFANATLSGADLSGADLREAALSGAMLAGVDIAGADLTGADLSGADLRGVVVPAANLEPDHGPVTLDGVDFAGANLSGAALPGADLGDLDFSGALLQGADLSGADLGAATLAGATIGYEREPHPNQPRTDLSGAALRGADLSGSTLGYVELPSADLAGADLSGADLTIADLSGADLSGADLTEATLSHADLSGADLSRADLPRANLKRVALWEATLEGADLSGTNLWEAFLSRAGQLPDLATCPGCGEDLQSSPPEGRPNCPNCLTNLQKALLERGASGAWWDSAEPGLGETVGVPAAHPLEERAERLLLAVGGREIEVTDGDRIGREIRQVLAEADRVSDARSVHREHALVDREGDSYFLSRIGENSLRVNGDPLGANERVRITDGDELTFGDVVTVSVRIEERDGS